jgi:hypothetical protein
MTEFFYAINKKTINYEIYINTEENPPFCECKVVNETTFLNENKV